LPGFTGEWEEKKLLDVLTVGHGQSQKGIGTSSGKYSILATSGEIGKTNYFLYDKPSVLIGRKGTIDKPQYVETPFWSIDTLFYTIIKNDYLPKYFFYLFCLIDWKKYNEASGVPSLTAYNIENIDVFIPPTLAEQSAIAAVLSDMDAEIEALTAKLNKAKLIKQGMMQELLTGRIRLVNVSPMQGEFTISEYMVILAIITKLFTDTGDTGMKFLKHTRYQKLVYLYLVYKKAKTCIFEKWDYGPFSKELAYTIVPKAENEKSYIVTDNDKNICVGKNINEAVKNAINKGYYKDAEQLVGRIRYKKDTELQVLATVIESIRDLEISQKAVSLQTVKEYIGSIPVWEYKLSLEYFTDFAIDKSIKEYYDFFK
jgi:restriction endonuclease S subunit